MRKLSVILAASSLAVAMLGGTAGADAVAGQTIADVAGDANLINCQQVVAPCPAPSPATAPASYGPADIREVSFATTYVAVPVGTNGIDYQATGFRVVFKTEAAPKSDGPTLIYRLVTTVGDCSSFLQAFLRGASSTPNDPAEKAIQWRQLAGACPDGVITKLMSFPAVVDATAKTLTMEFAYSKLTAGQQATMGVGQTVTANQGSTRTNFGTPAASATAPQIDESPASTDDFVIGSDLPADVPCTIGCP